MPNSSLLVFSDDWGRHPSSCQHLIRHLLGSHQVTWVNTIGTRKPRLDLNTLHRVLGKLKQWGPTQPQRPVASANPKVLNPRMWPWFGSRLSRSINRRMLSRAIAPAIRRLDAPPVAVTTIPLFADLVGVLPVRRWVYYCVDDFTEWPGYDGESLRKMEAELLTKVDDVVAVSETLRGRIARLGRTSHLLTHGIDPEFWAPTLEEAELPSLRGIPRPLVLFWGLIDRRLDLELVRWLSARMSAGSIVFVGPEDAPDPELYRIPRVVRLGAVAFEQLPLIAREASVLIMPYADFSVTQAMQPLKLKEYLATGKPVVARDLPASREWADALDLAATPEEFARLVLLRINEGVSPAQSTARQRLSVESWADKAKLFAGWLEGATPPMGTDTSTFRPLALRPPVILDARVVVGSGGGPDKTILNSARYLAPAGYHNLCLYMHPPDDVGFDALRQRARELDAPLVEVADRGLFDLGILWRLLAVCRREKVAIWHGHDYKSNLLGLILSRFWRMRLVTTVHGWVHHTARTPLYYAIDRLCLPRYELVLCVSDDLRKASIRAGVSPKRCVLVENGIDLDQYRRRLTVEQAKVPFGTPPGRTVLGAVGRLSAEKGFDLLIRSAAHLLGRGADLELWIVGAGDERDPLARLAMELGVADRVRLFGFRSDTIDLYQAMDVFVLSSLREGLPNVLLEAMALEVPIVATRIAGVPRLVEDGENGLLVDPGDFLELSVAIERLLNDRTLRVRITASARRTVEMRYSFAVRMERVRELYDRLLGRENRQ